MTKTKFSVELISFLSGFSGLTAYGAILGVLLVCGLGVPIPEDITLIAAGILASIGSISFTGALIAGFVGVLLGDCILFFAGRRYGYRVFKLPLFNKIFNERRIQLARQKVLSNSSFICFTARFLPGLRSPIFLTAGIMGVRPLTFLCLDGLAALISVPVWIYLGKFFGENMDDALSVAFRLQKYVIIGVAVLIAVYVWWKFYRRRKEEEMLKVSEPPPVEVEEVQSPQV